MTKVRKRLDLCQNLKMLGVTLYMYNGNVCDACACVCVLINSQNMQRLRNVIKL